MTTDVAEATPTPVTNEAPAPEVEVQSTTAEVPAAEAVTTPEAVSTETSDPPAEGFDFTQLPEYKEVFSAPEAKEAAAPEMPGVPVEQVLAQIEQQRATIQAQTLQRTDADWRNYLTNELGLSPQDAHNFWHGKLGPVLKDVFGNNEAFNKARFETAVDNVLPKESVELYRSRQYRGQHEAIKAIHDAGVAAERAKWEAQVKAGKFIPQSQVKKIAEASYARGQGGSPTSGSGQTLEGQPAGGVSFSNTDQLYTAWNEKRIDRATYARNYKRLTGRDPE